MTTGRSTTHDRRMARTVRKIGPGRLGFLLASWLFVACVLVQVFLVGLDVFAKVDSSLHRNFAYLYGWLAPALVLLSGTARVPSGIRTMTVTLLVLFAIQTVLPSLKDQFPTLAALHTVNALAIFALGMAIARRATEWARDGDVATVAVHRDE
jgi:hypothetical protein